MNCSPLCVLTFVLASCWGVVCSANVPLTSAAITRYMEDVPKHTVETSKEHREKELDAFFKTGKMPDAPVVREKKGIGKVAVDKMKNVPTEVLVKQFLEGGTQIEQYVATAGRGRGPDKTASPSIVKVNGKGKGNDAAPSKSPSEGEVNGKDASPSKSPKDSDGKGKKQKGKHNKDSHTKAPKEGKKGGKMNKDGKKGSDFPSSSPTPTLSIQGDVSLPPNIAIVEQHEANEDTGVGNENNGNVENGNDENGHEDKGKSADETDETDLNADNSSPSNSSSIAKIVSPLAAFAGLLFIAGFLVSRRRKSEGDNDQNENLMKHTREGFDVETGTVSGNTYRTGAFTEDDGTLEESVDVVEEKQSIIKSHATEMVTVVNELEDVSLSDDSASTTSVSSGSHSASDSCDGSLIEAARAAMTAEAFQPDKSKVYDSSVKPEWATRTSMNTDVETTNASDLTVPSEDNSDTREEKTKDEKTCKDNIEEIEELEINDHDVPTLPNLEPEPEENTSNGENSNTPAWMRAQLRPVSTKQSIPTSEVFSRITSGVDTEPEWMKKFKQMGLEKND